MDNLSFSLEQAGVSLPYNMQAEQAVLGAAILNKEVINSLMETLRAEYFYARQNSEIFAELVKMFATGTPIDFVTLLDNVVSAGIFASEEEAKVYLTVLVEIVPSISNVDSYAKIVYEKYLVRRLMTAATDILQQSSEESDADLLLEAAEQKIYEIRAGKDQSTMQPIEIAIIDTLSYLQKISGPDKDKYSGIPTGFTYLDGMLTGMGRSDLIILAARPGMGKTSFALNIATNVAKKQNIPVAIFSLEMTKDQLASKILSSEAGVSSVAMRTGELDAEDWNALAAASSSMAKAPIYLDDTSSITVPEIKAKVRRINQDPQKQNIGFIVIDYLQLMSSGKKTESRVQEISTITRNLKIMAKELNVPVMTLSQLSRATERGSTNNHRPMLSDLRDSGSIEQDADSVLFLVREAYYDDNEDADETKAECIVAKNRHGEVGSVALAWDGAHTRFMNVDYVHENNY